MIQAMDIDGALKVYRSEALNENVICVREYTPQPQASEEAGVKRIYREFNGGRIWLRKGCDLVHGKGWFAQFYYPDHKIGFGFSKNKFTAVRKAITTTY